MVLLLRNVRLYGEGEPVNILTAGGEIIGLGKGLESPVPTVDIIEGEGRAVIPGYIDQHVHVTGGGGEGGFTKRVPELKLSDCVRGGVTTLVGLLGTDGTTRSVENLVAKVKALKEEGLTTYCLTGSYEYPSPTLTGSVKKDIVFIDECIGVKIAISDHRSSNICKADLIRLASEARLAGVIAGKPGYVHMHTGSGRKKLDDVFDILRTEEIPIQTFRPTHVGKMYDDAIRFANMGGYIDFTTGDKSSKTAAQLARAVTDTVPERVTMSTDANGSIPKWNDRKEMIGLGIGQITTMHDTVCALVKEQGLPLRDAIQFCTRNIAKALGIYPRKGDIREGSDADLLVLDGDLSISSTIAKGTVMMKEKIVLRKGVFED